MPKSPPRIPSTPATRRVFAHLLTADLACPNCGTVHPHRLLRQSQRPRKGPKRCGYEPLTGVFECRVCRRTYLMGVLYWPLTGAKRAKRSADSVPLPGEAVALRQDSSRVVLGSYTEARGHANRVADDDDDDSVPPDAE